MGNKPDVIAIYGFSHHTDPDGRASRDDGRYHEENLYLYSDGTFKLVEQNGWLSPKYESKIGTWDIVDNELILSIEQKQYTSLPHIDPAYNNKEITEQYISSKTLKKVMNHSFADRDKEWKYKQGMRPDDLFEKYNNKQLFKEIRSNLSTKMLELKLKFSTSLVNDQPSVEKLLKWMPDNFTIDSLTEFKYCFKALDYTTITAHLHLETRKIVYVEFFETEKEVKEITRFLLKEKGYKYVASEHMCDYFNNKKNAIQMCPGMEKGTMIDVSKYEKL